MDFWHGFLVLTFVHLLAAAAPGPDFAFVTRQALMYGRKAGLLASLGIALGLAIHISYAAAGLAAVVVHSLAWMTVLKYIGGAYLLFLGIKGLRARLSLAWQDGVSRTACAPSTIQQVLVGLLCNALNPKAPIYFLSLFTVVLSPDLPLPTLAFYGVWIMLLQLLWFSTMTLCFTHTAVRSRFLAVGHWIDRAFGLAMIALGLRVLLAEHR
ncbi:MAG: LysE family translocator [Candidatus Tectomicrobia bacterium]|uniref:LysE family translocator n=1 Tax=Tectimicrobiota bacterium TaxID=2528274 RepID=A0A937W2W1_UNCTE|nr:LysE family translocator [Candidatus Tectomicrobia bacterium]